MARPKNYQRELPSMMTIEFNVRRDDEKCIRCRVCEQQCANDVHKYWEDIDTLTCTEMDCVACQRCVTMCPTQALQIKEVDTPFRPHANLSPEYLRNIYKQARTGGVLLSGMGNDKKYPIYWDHLLLDACQVTNPSIDPLREPMELRTFLGPKPEGLNVKQTADGPKLDTVLANNLVVEMPILFSAMSYGAVSLNVQKSLAGAAWELGTFWNTGEGGLHKDLYKYGPRTIVQVASGRYGVHAEYLNAAAAIEIKVGQGAKPGIGGHLPGEKINEAISSTRSIPTGADALSPAPHHDIYSIEDLRQLIYSLKEATDYKKPIIVKIAAVHNSPAIASGMVRAGADIIALDGFRGGTGAAPTMIRDNVGIPIELALAAVDDRLRSEGIRHKASVLVAGGFRCSADVVKAIALGADAVYIGTAALVALGCHMCQKCYTGKCNWGVCATNPALTRRLNPEMGIQRATNLLAGWAHEIQETIGAMGINSIESLRGNRERLRSVGLSESEMEILGVKPAGR